MVARHGWKSKPTPRRGFTVVEALRVETTSPVVVAVHDHHAAIHLFRAAAEEAMGRCRDLVVLDYGERPLRQELDRKSAAIDPRERTSLRTLLANPHVRMIRAEPIESGLEKAVEYCEAVKACLLVIGADHIGGADLTPSLTARIFDGDFDVLVLADHSEHVSGSGQIG